MWKKVRRRQVFPLLDLPNTDNATDNHCKLANNIRYMGLADPRIRLPLISWKDPGRNARCRGIPDEGFLAWLASNCPGSGPNTVTVGHIEEMACTKRGPIKKSTRKSKKKSKTCDHRRSHGLSASAIERAYLG